jgi:hypothetical protein
MMGGSEGYLFDMGARPGSAEFRNTVRAFFDLLHPGRTDEDLLCEPAMAARFCDEIRRAHADPSIEDHRILRTLMRLRKEGGHAFARGRGLPFRLAEELRAAGCDLDRVAFADAIAEEFHGWCRNATDEDLLCRPREGAKFCRAVRRELRLRKLPDRVILRTLIGRRKGGYARMAI